MSARNMAKRTAAGTLALAVCLGGGALALAGAANADANFQFSSRIQGADRYGTAIAASQAAFKDGSAQNVVIVNGYATVDGLTASYLAGVANAPILYVDQNGASDATKAELKRLGAKNIWLVGGTTVIPQSVQDAMSGAGYTVNRINGSDRYETAKLIAEAGAKMAGKQPAKVFVASGDSFADALAVSPIAYAKGYAIALTQKDTTSAFTTKELGNIGTNTKILVGGTAVVSDSVAQNLTVSQRIAGADRGVTANLVADYANSTEGFNASQAALVGGTDGNGADSLVGASVLGKTMTALHFAGWDSTTQWFKDHSAALTGAGVIFGGKAAVSDGQVSTVQSAAQTVAAVTNYIVTDATGAASGNFVYADPTQGLAVTAKFTSGDTFMVDGVKATLGVFTTSLSTGDVVSFTKTGSGNAWTLTNKAQADYTSGLVWSATGSSIVIGEPVTGAALNTIDLTYMSGNFTLYQIGGQAVSATVFNNTIQPGDQVSVSGTGADASHIRTVSLNSQVTGGVVSAFTNTSATATSLSVTPANGAALTYTITSAATVTIDGAAATNFTAFQNALSAGDKVTVSNAGGVQKVALSNAAPKPIAGQITAASSILGKLTSFTYVPAGQAATTVNTADTTALAATTTAFASGTAQVDTLTFASTPIGKNGNVTLSWTGSGSLAGKSVTVPFPATGVTASTFATTIQTAINGLTGVSGYTVASTSASVYTITSGSTTVASGTVAAGAWLPSVTTVDGNLSSGDDVVTAATIGDTVTWQAPDASTSTKARLDLVSGPFGGVVNGTSVNTSTTSHTVAVYAAGSTTNTLAYVDYNSATAAGLTGTTINYVVNGTNKGTDNTAFAAAIGSIKAGGLTGSIKVTQSGTITTFAVSTAVAS